MHAPHFISSIGSSTGRIAKRFGHGTADLAMRVGGGTKDVARRIGPKRGILGIVMLGGAVVGGMYLLRFLKRRNAEMESMEMSDEELAKDGRRRMKKSNKSPRVQDAITY